jgi:hypothetical protein
MTDRIAASATQAAVQTAVNAAVDGDRVLIPNGSATWSTGITTTKQIIIQAQNYTPTFQGTAARNVILTNNSSTPMFSLTSGSAYHCGVGGIRFNEGTGNVNHVRLLGSGSKIPIVFDCYFQDKSRSTGASDEIACMNWQSLGGLLLNCRSEGTFDVNGVGQVHGYVGKSSRAWTTASTMGSADTTGSVNIYYEDCYFKNLGPISDTDRAGRLVVRYSMLDGAWVTHHGFSSGITGRHSEYYNNTFTCTTTNRNLAARYTWLRAGTAIYTNNVVNAGNVGYGNNSLGNFGDDQNPPGSYPVDMQCGRGHNGSSHISDPIYAWSNTGGSATAFSVQSNWTTHIQSGRDYFPTTAKTGYTKYTYPHPLRTVIEGGNPPVGTPIATVR